MANPWRSEVEVIVNGESVAARLTLGALAELEAANGSQSLFELIERFEARRFRTEDVIDVLCAGLRGGGWVGSRDDLLAAEVEGGPIAAGKAAGALLLRAFALPEA